MCQMRGYFNRRLKKSDVIALSNYFTDLCGLRMVEITLQNLEVSNLAAAIPSPEETPEIKLLMKIVVIVVCVFIRNTKFPHRHLIDVSKGTIVVSKLM